MSINLQTGAYTLGGITPSSKLINAVMSRSSPTTYDAEYEVGQIWINQSNGSVYILSSFSTSTGIKLAIWSFLGGNDEGFPITPYVVGPSGQAGYQTIQSALDAAGASGTAQMVYIQPGTYTENLTFPDVDISIWGDRAANSIISGQHTPSATANLELHALLLISSTNVLNSNAGGSGSIEISDSFIIITDGFVFNLPNWTGELLLDDCGEASTNDGVVNNTAGAPIKFLNTEMGAGSGRTMTLTGNANVRFDTCNVNCPVNIAGTGTLIMQNGCKFANTVTIGGSKTGAIVSTDFLTGANQAFVYNSSGNTYLSGATINSSNNPAIGGTGAGILTLGDITFIEDANIANTLTIEWATTRTGLGSYPITPFVVGSIETAGYQTIASAITAAAAVGGGIIYIQPGTYTENLTFSDNIQLVSIAYEDIGDVVLTGVHTPPNTGAIAIRGLRLNSATHIFNSNAAGSSNISILECTFAVTDGFVFNLPNWTGTFNINDCGSSGTNDGVINNSAGANIFTNNCQIGAGTTRTFTANGDVRLDLTFLDAPANISSGNLFINFALFSKTLTLSGDVAGGIVLGDFFTGASPSLIMSSTGAISLRNSTINSSNNPAIDGAGAGVLTITDLNFLDNSSIAGTLTLAYGQTTTGPISVNGETTISSGTDAINISADAAATTLNIGTGAAAKIINIGSTNTTSATNLTAGSGAVNCATDFNLTAAATKISLNGGSVTDFIGTGTLTNGVLVVANTNIAATDRIFLQRTAVNASTATGNLTYAISAGANFTVTSTEPATPGNTEVNDQSSFVYIIFRET